ncbi:methyltransferase domain-containing protein [Granulosicoccus sp. 3-233]|uniref:methyltransferase domain-containing protein n=1 Tax=Granulosicoccus sp. 3-233 TaxID=3417969 RepID=UPI003D34C639
MEFDAEITQTLERCYLGADVTQRRKLSFEALDPAPGESILDIGCGNAMLTVELARAVGVDGRVIGVDPSTAMRDAAIRRCSEIPSIDIREGTATKLPVENDSIDKAVSLQVFEYLDDIPNALSESYRILRKNGKLVVGDMHFDSWVWFSKNPGRMDRVIRAWDEHLSERCVPAIISPHMREQGFYIDKIQAHTFCDYKLKPDGIANMLLTLMERFCITNKLIRAEDIIQWRDEQHDLARSGQFFFSITHYIVIARK